MSQDSQKMLFSDSLKEKLGSRDWLRALLEYTIRSMLNPPFMEYLFRDRAHNLMF